MALHLTTNQASDREAADASSGQEWRSDDAEVRSTPAPAKSASYPPFRGSAAGKTAPRRSLFRL